MRVWLLEGVMIIEAVATWHNPPVNIGVTLAWLILGYLALVTIIDLEQRLILHPVSLIGVGLCVPAGILEHGWQSKLSGGLAGGAGMLVFYLLGLAFGQLMRRKHLQADPEQKRWFLAT